jgi:hypothetical protein
MGASRRKIVKKQKRIADPEELPFHYRELLRRQRIAAAVQIPAEPPDLLEDKRAIPPKRGSYS